MTTDTGTVEPQFHQHVFLGEGHEQSERKTWTVIWLCGAMMCAEIVGGLLFGSIALVADGLHMSTHAGALLLAALAYTYARRHAGNANFTFGTGKFGDLAGFTSAIVLAMIAILIGYESVTRFWPRPDSLRGGHPNCLSWPRREHRKRLALEQRRSPPPRSQPW
jgi:Co/Zn/Cd efflux system component